MAVYCYLAYLTYIQSTSWEMLGWMKHKLESRDAMAALNWSQSHIVIEDKDGPPSSQLLGNMSLSVTSQWTPHPVTPPHSGLVHVTQFGPTRISHKVTECLCHLKRPSCFLLCIFHWREMPEAAFWRMTDMWALVPVTQMEVRNISQPADPQTYEQV